MGNTVDPWTTQVFCFNSKHYSTIESAGGLIHEYKARDIKEPLYGRPTVKLGFPGGSVGKESTFQCRRWRFSPWVGKIPWRRAWQPTPVFLPENPMDGGAWWATVHGVHTVYLQHYERCDSYLFFAIQANSQTWLKRLSTHTLSSCIWIFGYTGISAPNLLCGSRVNCTPLQSPQMDSRDVGNREILCDLFMKRKEERPLDLIKMLSSCHIIAI